MNSRIGGQPSLQRMSPYSQTVLNSISKEIDTLATATPFIRAANRLLRDTDRSTHCHTFLMLKQLEPGKASNTLSACLQTFASAAYGSALTPLFGPRPRR